VSKYRHVGSPYRDHSFGNRVTGEGVVGSDIKNHTTRVVPVLSILDREIGNLLDGRAPDALVFPRHKGGLLTSTEFRWVFDQAAKVAEPRGVVPHVLRHTAASLVIRAGANSRSFSGCWGTRRRS
jgi:integrase